MLSANTMGEAAVAFLSACLENDFRKPEVRGLTAIPLFHLPNTKQLQGAGIRPSG